MKCGAPVSAPFSLHSQHHSDWRCSLGPRGIVLSGFLSLVLSAFAFAANHPAVTGKNANCSACHADMLTGRSVHSEGELACTLCHTSVPEGDKAAMSLILPKEQLCFACHERTAMQQHWPESKRDCLGCHDTHRSDRAMLLRRGVETKEAYSETSSPKAQPNTSRQHTKKTQPARTADASNRGQSTAN